jgi:elongation factor Tu
MGNEKFDSSKLYVGTIGRIEYVNTTVTAAMQKVLAKHNPKICSSHKQALVEWLDAPGLRVNPKIQFRSFDSIDNAPEASEIEITISMSHVANETENWRYDQVDCLGHAGDLKYMITGAAQMDGAILMAAATDGPMPPTRGDRINLRRGVPATVGFMNQVAPVDDSALLCLAWLELRKFSMSYGFPGYEIPVGSANAPQALNGDGCGEKRVDELMEAVDNYIPQPARVADKPFLRPVEDIFSIYGRGTVATARIELGKLKVGEEVEIIGIKATSKSMVTGAEIFTRLLDSRMADDNVGLLLMGMVRKAVEQAQGRRRMRAQFRRRTQPVLIVAMASCMASIDGDRMQFQCQSAYDGCGERWIDGCLAKFHSERYAPSNGEAGRRTRFFSGCRPSDLRTTGVTGVATLNEEVEMVMPGDNSQLTIRADHGDRYDEAPEIYGDPFTGNPAMCG